MKTLDINLDAINDFEELWDISMIYKSYWEYAYYKSTAIKFRKRGNIRNAIVFEGLCDKIYKDIPEEYRVW